LVEKSFSLPDEFKFRFNKTKWLMREILKEVINKNIAEAPKRPIQTPQREWLSNELKDWVFDTVMTGVDNTNWLNKSIVEKELDLFFNHDNSNSFYIWQWISIGLIFNKK
jgi:asparagine synthase (glutamine-hydrolysing)